jgi:hypothetical protein
MSLSRPLHPGLAQLDQELRAGTPLDAIRDKAERSKRTYGEIWPFEFNAIDSISQAKTKDAVRAILDEVAAHSFYQWPFKDGERVVNLIEGRGLEKGKGYVVVDCYDGHSGAGAQTWVRVMGDDGAVVGYDPDRFIREDIYLAIQEARQGDGVLVRRITRGWARPTLIDGAQFIADELIDRLIFEEKLLDNHAPIDGQPAMQLVEEHPLVKRSGFGMTANERIIRKIRDEFPHAPSDQVSRLAAEIMKTAKVKE